MAGLRPNILVFACGDAAWGQGGSGFESMVMAARAQPPGLDAWICGVVSNHCGGGVAAKAERLKVRMSCWEQPLKHPDPAVAYRNFVNYYNADLVMLSGWVFPVYGLETARVVNIHPAPLNYRDPARHFGGKGFHGLFVHEKVLEAYRQGLITRTEVTMHFVPPYARSGYDSGPVICRVPVIIHPDDTPASLQERVKDAEHTWQSRVLDAVVHGRVRLVNGEVVYETEELKRRLLPVEP